MADSTFPISSVSAAVSSRAAFHEISEFLKNSEISWKAAREETAAVTEEIGKVESAIDERVKGLYGS